MNKFYLALAALCVAASAQAASPCEDCMRAAHGG